MEEEKNNKIKEETDLSYTALYRKFRPLKFSEIVGQDHITQTLKNARLFSSNDESTIKYKNNIMYAK